MGFFYLDERREINGLGKSYRYLICYNRSSSEEAEIVSTIFGDERRAEQSRPVSEANPAVNPVQQLKQREGPKRSGVRPERSAANYPMIPTFGMTLDETETQLIIVIYCGGNRAVFDENFVSKGHKYSGEE